MSLQGQKGSLNVAEGAKGLYFSYKSDNFSEIWSSVQESLTSCSSFITLCRIKMLKKKDFSAVL